MMLSCWMFISLAYIVCNKGTLTGILGDLDGDPSNDLLLPNGTSLGTNATEETIFRAFNTACT